MLIIVLKSLWKVRPLAHGPRKLSRESRCYFITRTVSLHDFLLPFSIPGSILLELSSIIFISRSTVEIIGELKTVFFTSTEFAFQALYVLIEHEYLWEKWGCGRTTHWTTQVLLFNWPNPIISHSIRFRVGICPQNGIWEMQISSSRSSSPLRRKIILSFPLTQRQIHTQTPSHTDMQAPPLWTRSRWTSQLNWKTKRALEKLGTRRDLADYGERPESWRNRKTARKGGI